MKYTYTREEIQELHEFLYKNDIYSVAKVEKFIEKHCDDTDTSIQSHWIILLDRYKDIMNSEYDE